MSDSIVIAIIAVFVAVPQAALAIWVILRRNGRRQQAAQESLGKFLILSEMLPSY